MYALIDWSCYTIGNQESCDEYIGKRVCTYLAPRTIASATPWSYWPGVEARQNSKEVKRKR